jgi:alkaline phosphatase D
VRVEVDEAATHPHQYSRIYRRFQFGDLIDLYMLDTRTYRSAHPCGEKDYAERYGAFNCENTLLETRTILGGEQKSWLMAGLIQSTTRWQVLGNQTFMGRLGIATPQDSAVLDINVDAWDGYKAERQELLETLKASGRKDLVVLTGDLHTYIASELKLDFEDINPLSINNYIGVEFMTPSVTSAGLMELVLKQTPTTQQAAVIQALSRSAVQLTNSHIRFFDSTRHGYSTIEFSQQWCEWRAYTIDKNNNSANNPRFELFRCKKYLGIPWLM